MNSLTWEQTDELLNRLGPSATTIAHGHERTGDPGHLLPEPCLP